MPISEYRRTLSERLYPHSYSSVTLYAVKAHKTYFPPEYVVRTEVVEARGKQPNPDSPTLSKEYPCTAKELTWWYRTQEPYGSKVVWVTKGIKHTLNPNAPRLATVEVKPYPQPTTTPHGSFCDADSPTLHHPYRHGNVFVDITTTRTATTFELVSYRDGDVCFFNPPRPGTPVSDYVKVHGITANLTGRVQTLRPAPPGSYLGFFEVVNPTNRVRHNVTAPPGSVPLCGPSPTLNGKVEPVYSGGVTHRVSVDLQSSHPCYPTITPGPRFNSFYVRDHTLHLLTETEDIDSQIHVSVPGRFISVHDHREPHLHPTVYVEDKTPLTWYQRIWHDLLALFTGAEALLAWATNNAVTLLYLAIVASPIMSAAPLALRVTLAAVITTPLALASDGGELMIELPPFLLLHMLLTIVTCTTLRDPVMTIAYALGLAFEIPALALLINLLALCSRRKPTTVDILFQATHIFPGLLPLFAHHVFNNGWLLPKLERWAERAESEAHDSLPKTSPMGIYARRLLFLRDFGLQHHSLSASDFIVTSLQEFMKSSRRKSYTRKERRRVHIVPNTPRTFKNHFFYADEYAQVSRWLGEMSAKDLRYLRANLPPITARKKWQLDEVFKVVSRTNYSGTFAIEPG